MEIYLAMSDMKQLDIFTYDLPSSEDTKPKDRGYVVHGRQKISNNEWNEWMPVTSGLEKHDIHFWFQGYVDHGKSGKSLGCGTYDYDLTVKKNKQGIYTLTFVDRYPNSGSWKQDFSTAEALVEEIVRVRKEKDERTDNPS